MTAAAPTIAACWPTRWFHRRVSQHVSPVQGRYEPIQVRNLAGIHLDDDEVIEFIGIYEQLTGVVIDQTAAREKAVALMLFVHSMVRQDATIQASQAHATAR